MELYVVQQGDTIQSIADHYMIPVEMLIRDNGLTLPYVLVIGQALVIAIPESIYTVKEGDTLVSIANSNNVSVMNLLMNNPYLSDREFLFPGDTIIIKYSTKGTITTHGNTVPYIDKSTLKKTLPYLTYLSILNFTATRDGEIITYYDDTNIISMAKVYGVMPLMLLTTLTVQGEANIGIAYDILLNEEIQNKQIENILTLLKTKGYYGINISFEYVSVANFDLYEKYLTKISKRINEEGYLVFTTINTNITNVNQEVRFEKVDYSTLDQLAQNIIFMNYEWATNINPPSPISSIYNIDAFLNYVSEYIAPDKEIIGLATIGYDWELPFLAGLSSVYSLTLERAIDLARNGGAEIKFDEISQTPFFNYIITMNQNSIAHIVWFIDPRSVNALLDLAVKYNLHGISIWNITIYNPQLWLVINSQYDIVKLL